MAPARASAPMSERGVLLVRSQALSAMFRRAEPRQQEQIVQSHRHFESQFKAAPADNPAGIAAGTHDVIDEAVDTTLKHDKHGRDVTCRRGCSACCRLHVVVTKPEAVLARMAADDVGWQVDRERARLQARMSTTEQWRELSDADRACVFLTPAGECAIYEHRPMACRKYMVISDPVDCDSVLMPGHKVGQLVCVGAEIVFSASLTVFESGTLAAMVLAELEAEGGDA
jgi:Fe-S-cluster containining protein